MYNQDKEARKQKVLEIIIHSYISSASPVGSRTISRKYRMGLSPASIRNIMAELEEMSFIMQPHTSAGRIPTDKGYRYYIDSLMNTNRLSKEEEERIKRELNSKIEEIGELIQKTTKILSSVTNQLSLVLLPCIRRDLFRHIELVPINKKKVLVVLITTTGLIRDAAVDFEKPVEPNELRRIANFLNQELEDVPLYEIKDYILRRLLQEKSSFYHLYKFAQEVLQLSSLLEEEERLFMDGASHIFEQPEFKDYERMRHVLRALDERGELMELLEQDMESDDVNVHIGDENPYEYMRGCSLVTSSYKAQGRPMGTLAVLGPTRMEYSKVIPIVRYVSSLVSDILTRLNG